MPAPQGPPSVKVLSKKLSKFPSGAWDQPGLLSSDRMTQIRSGLLWDPVSISPFLSIKPLSPISSRPHVPQNLQEGNAAGQ